MNAIAPSARDRLARRLVLGLLLFGLFCEGIGELIITLQRQPLGIDFLPVWTAARQAWTNAADLYDFAAISRLQGWVLHDRYGLRPFAYPPSALLFVAPFATMPFWVAYGLWVALTGAFMLWATARLAPGRPWLAALVALLATPCFTMMLVGQTTFLIAGLVAVAVPRLERRPILAGVLLAVAALIKPTTLILAPFALLSGGHWRALTWAFVAGLTGGLISIAVFGLQPWFDWLAALPRFQVLFETNDGLLRGTITPSGEAVALGIGGLGLLAVRLVCVLTAAALIWRVFKSVEDPGPRMAALLGAGLLAAPYAMHYDGGLLAPAVALAMARTLDDRDWLRGIAGILLLTGTGIPHMGAFATIALVPLLVWPGLNLNSSTFLRRKRSVSTP